MSVPTVPRITPVELRGPQGMRVLPKPVNATAVRFTHPTCQDRDAVGLIFLIDTFPSHSTLSRLILILPFVFLFFPLRKKKNLTLCSLNTAKGKSPHGEQWHTHHPPENTQTLTKSPIRRCTKSQKNNCQPSECEADKMDRRRGDPWKERAAKQAT